MKSEELDSLGEQRPKLTGFKLLIPNPRSLYSYVCEAASRSGDSTLAEQKEQFNKLLNRLLNKLPGTQEWQVAVDDVLLKKIEIILEASYSEHEGEWANISAAFWLEKERSWKVVSKRQKIFTILEEKGFEPILETDSRGKFSLSIPNKNGDLKAFWTLGYESLGKALRFDKEASAWGNNPLMIYLENLPLSYLDFLTRIQYFQDVVCHGVDALYEAFGLTPPGLTLKLTVQK